jgi:prepilin-type N-terminal cleavage/methylation domain-containing protein
MGRRRAHSERRHGFTLVEVLAALAIAAVIIAATGALVHNVALHFDYGTRGVSEGERLILAVERLASDIGSARFVTRMSEGGAALAFTGEPATAAQPARMIFVSAGAVAASGEEVVSLTVEQDEDVARLVRRRAPWNGPRTRFEDITLQDPVVLLEGKFLMSFAFGRLSQDNALAWSDDWRGQMMPRFVQLKLRDRLTGADLLTGADFVIRADASAGCAQVGSQVGSQGGSQGGSQVGSQGGSAACVSSATAKSRRGHDD